MRRKSACLGSRLLVRILGMADFFRLRLPFIPKHVIRREAEKGSGDEIPGRGLGRRPKWVLGRQP